MRLHNPKEIDVPTITQKPDNVLTLEKKGADVQYEYVFDAKYRINPALPGTDYYNSIGHTPGPEIGDINTMHRYRDAIVYRNGASPFERTMFGAYVLFPYSNEKEYRNHRFYGSIDKVNIGGLPFLPSATEMVTDMLDQLIADTIDFCKTIHFIDDTTMRDILARDLRECAVAIVARQDKLASIMCGSIIEALLMCKITERGISKYDISEISKAKTANNYVVSSMSLSELLYVARQEDLITINSYRLGHYIRDYRNIVHPAKEKRMKEEINHENVLMMWSVLKRISGELLHTT